MNRTLASFGIAILMGVVGSASAAITYSNISVSGSVASPRTVTQGSNDIDFAFASPGGVVGDTVAPIRWGNIVITFDVLSTSGPITSDIASFLGAVLGSGVIIFNEVIEDNITGAIIASANRTINVASGLPLTVPINFTAPSTNFKVKKTFFLYAPETAGVDLAQIGLVEQRFVPTPGGVALCLAGCLVAVRRRRS